MIIIFYTFSYKILEMMELWRNLYVRLMGSNCKEEEIKSEHLKRRRHRVQKRKNKLQNECVCIRNNIYNYIYKYIWI
jgi:hypothetical protein